MREITYREFRETVATASGTFSYIFAGQRFTTNPVLYKICNGTAHLQEFIK